MGKIIEFLARAGSDATLRHAPADAVRTALLEAGVDDDELGRVLSANDGDALRALVGRHAFFCSQLPDGPSREEEEDPLDGDDEDEDGGEPDRNISRTPPPDAFR